MRIAAPIAALLNWLYPPALPLGQRGELAAAKYLRKQGYRILAGGVRGRRGEIDIIALDGRTVVFVEVKTRSTSFAGNPVEAVDRKKQQSIVRTALAFLKQHQLLECNARFDIIGIAWMPEVKQPDVRHYRDAFRPESFGQFYS